MLRLLCASSLVVVAVFTGACLYRPTSTLAAESYKPTYNAEGALLVPANYREWIYLTSGMDMVYAAPSAGEAPPAHSVFDNVFVNPEAYRAFLETGTWPDKTVFVLENRSGVTNASINKGGRTQSVEVSGVELHVKDNGVWKFYVDGKKTHAKLVPPPASCYTCHEAHAAVDTTFVQFYPTLLPVAQQKKTLSAKYLQEIAIPAASAPVAQSK